MVALEPKLTIQKEETKRTNQRNLSLKQYKISESFENLKRNVYSNILNSETDCHIIMGT